MKKFNNKIIRYLLIIVGILGISFGIEVFGFNFKLLTLDEVDSGVTELSYKSEVTGDKSLIKINLDGLYVNKLIVEYEADADVEYKLNYSERDYYNGLNVSTVDDIFDNEVNEAITNIKNEVENIEISYDIDKEIRFKSIFIDNSVRINYFRIIFMCFVMSAMLILSWYYKNGGHTSILHRYFIIMGLILGGAMIILQPSATYYCWDDQIHFLNVYELAGGNLDWSVGEVQMVLDEAFGRDSIDSIEEQINQKQYLNRDELAGYSTYGGRFITYNKLAYIPSAIGYYSAKLIGLPFDICFMFGKFMNLLVYLFLIGYAIKITKVGKRLLVVLGFIPTSLFLASQYSYDSAVIAGFILAMVMLVNWFIDKECKVDFKSLLIFILAMLYGCFPKAVYIPFILLFLFVPTDRFRSKRESILVKSGIFVICLLMMATFVLPVVSGGAVTGDARGGDTSVAGQLKVILSNPFGYVKILNDTMVKNFISSFIGIGALGSFAYMGNLSTNLYLIFLILLIVVSFIEASKFNIDKVYKGIFLVITLGVVLLIWTALYLSFTPVGYNTINGVQPRYFIPLLFPFLICLGGSKFKFKVSSKLYNLVVLLVPVIVIFIAIYQLILSNYCM